MFKIVSIMLGAHSVYHVYSLTEIHTEEEYVILPANNDAAGPDYPVTYVGYVQEKYVDTRTEEERWRDEYDHSYYPEHCATPVEVAVPPCVKRIRIPHTVRKISKQAFKRLTDVVFEIDERNQNYKIEDNKIIDTFSGEVIWPYRP